jgi:hypothetical protein
MQHGICFCRLEVTPNTKASGTNSIPLGIDFFLTLENLRRMLLLASVCSPKFEKDANRIPLDEIR